MNRKTLLIIVTFCSTLCSTKAQFSTQHDPSIEWQYIDTEWVRVIFPKKTPKQAYRIAQIIGHLHKKRGTSIGERFEKIDVVLQTEQVVSNGFVTLMPYRSELFGTAPSNFKILGSANWLDLLSIHEYRHAQQYANAKGGWTRFLYWLSGENGWALGLFSSIPDWYLEGDAVLAESLYTQNGRGRSPYFFKELRALLLSSDKIQPYAQARNGSFKKLVPNKYVLGFHLANHLRNAYGTETGKRVFEEASRFTYGFAPFSMAMKKNTGLWTSQLYREAYQKLQKKWAAEVDTLSLTASKKISAPRPNCITDYSFAQFLRDGGLVCIKKSYQETPQLIQIKNQKEHKLLDLDISVQEYMSVKNNKLAWTSFEKHPRWDTKNFSNVVTYDLKKGLKKQLTHREKLFSPEFSEEGSRIVAVRSDEKLQNRLVILDATSGKITQVLPNEKNDFLSFPKWGLGDTCVYYLVQRDGKIAFFKWIFSTESTEQLSDWTAHAIGSFSVSEKNLYFSASYKGIDNIYALATDGSRKIEQITSDKVGASTPAFNPKDSTLVYSAFRTGGNALFQTDLSSKTPPLLKVIEPMAMDRFALHTTETESPFLTTLSEKTYPSKPYQGFFKGMKLHSWGVFVGENQQVLNGFQLQASNVLQNTAAQFQIASNPNENSQEFSGSLHYLKKRIGLHAQIEHKKRETSHRYETNFVNESFTEHILGTGLSVPLSWIHGNYKTAFSLSEMYRWHRTSNYRMSPDLQGGSEKKYAFGTLESQLSLSSLRRTALQNLAPRWGYALQIQQAFSFTKNPVTNWLSLATVYLPGILKNHSTSLFGIWKKQPLSNAYRFPDLFSYARGYVSTLNDEAQNLSYNYRFPLCYPDLALGNAIYLQRIRANVFMDRSVLKLYAPAETAFEPIKTRQNSLGVELIFDTQIFNSLPVSIGVRKSYLQNPDSYANKKKQVVDVFYRINL